MGHGCCRHRAIATTEGVGGNRLAVAATTAEDSVTANAPLPFLVNIAPLGSMVAAATLGSAITAAAASSLDN